MHQAAFEFSRLSSSIVLPRIDLQTKQKAQKVLILLQIFDTTLEAPLRAARSGMARLHRKVAAEVLDQENPVSIGVAVKSRGKNSLYLIVKIVFLGCTDVDDSSKNLSLERSILGLLDGC